MKLRTLVNFNDPSDSAMWREELRENVDNLDTDKLSLDGTDIMSGAIQTSVGTFEHTVNFGTFSFSEPLLGRVFEFDPFYGSMNSTAGAISFEVNGTSYMTLNTANFSPTNSALNPMDLGKSTGRWDTIFLAGNIDAGAAGCSFGASVTHKVGFHGTKVIQHTSTGSTAGFTAGSGTSANDDSTFSGGSGTGYTMDDVVKALKDKGILGA